MRCPEVTVSFLSNSRMGKDEDNRNNAYCKQVQCVVNTPCITRFVDKYLYN